MHVAIIWHCGMIDLNVQGMTPIALHSNASYYPYSQVLCACALQTTANHHNFWSGSLGSTIFDSLLREKIKKADMGLKLVELYAPFWTKGCM